MQEFSEALGAILTGFKLRSMEAKNIMISSALITFSFEGMLGCFFFSFFFFFMIMFPSHSHYRLLFAFHPSSRFPCIHPTQQYTPVLTVDISSINESTSMQRVGRITRGHQGTVFVFPPSGAWMWCKRTLRTSMRSSCLL